MTTRAKLLALSVASCVLAACGGGGSSEWGAAKALRVQMEQLSNGQFGPLYDELHPAQQAVIDKSGFMQCAAKAVVGEFKVTKIKDQYAEKVDIPGTDVKGVDSVALTAEVRSGTDTDTLTLHEIEVDGEWLWVVTSPADHDPATC